MGIVKSVILLVTDLKWLLQEIKGAIVVRFFRLTIMTHMYFAINTLISTVLGRRYGYMFDKKIKHYCGNLAFLVTKLKCQRASAFILFFGDSVMERISRHDKDNRTIDEMLSDFLKKKESVVSLSNSGYQLEVFYNYLLVVEKLKTYPVQVIIPINIRSFSPQWNLNPAYQYNSQVQHIKDYLNRGQFELKEFRDIESFEDSRFFLNMSVDYPDTYFTKIGEFEKEKAVKTVSNERYFTRKKNIFIYHYCYALNGNHRRIDTIRRIADLLQSKEIIPIFYFTPINYEAGISFAGKVFMDRVTQNINVIKNAILSWGLTELHYKVNLSQAKLTGKAGCLFDLSFMLNRNFFFHNDLATEHLNEKGRMLLASILTNIL